ncbi:MAG TPA: phosphoribosylformylglycinamidine cyclo-ligase [Acidimicrobiia bacterium]|nr:phosphoribosylformylglycinamidine cyclo-ligase [Acidimicrobiia bacterium]
MSPRRGEAARLTYAEAGVDIAAGDKAVERIKDHVRSTFRPGVLGDLGGFGGLFDVGRLGYEDPLLVSTTDGVGTKSVIAQQVGRYDTIGIDCVAMSVDDLAAHGADPLFFLDYVSVGRLDADQIDDLVGGVAHGCRDAGCALLGGEMSEHPGVLEPGAFDLVGFAVGAVERARLLPAGVTPGDRVLGLASPGLRCNGYSLAREAFTRAGRSLDGPAWRGARHTLGAELLRPSVIYAPALRDLRRRVAVHALAHVTGGGLAANLARVLPERCDAVLLRGAWDVPRIFSVVQAAGDIADEEMEHVFNLGLGMLAVVAPDDVHRALDVLRATGHPAWPVGAIEAGHGRVRFADAAG